MQLHRFGFRDTAGEGDKRYEYRTTRSNYSYLLLIYSLGNCVSQLALLCPSASGKQTNRIIHAAVFKTPRQNQHRYCAHNRRTDSYFFTCKDLLKIASRLFNLTQMIYFI